MNRFQGNIVNKNGNRDRDRSRSLKKDNSPPL
jgi:hypothetical protein